MTLDSALALQAAQIAEICRRHRVNELAIFGSASRDELRPESDIDFLVEFDPGARATYFDLFALEREMEALFARRVEATTRQSLKPWIRASVEQNARTIYHAA